MAGGRTRVDTKVADLPVWVSKSDRGRFAALGLKIGGTSGMAEWRRWRALVAIAKLASKPNKVKAVCPSNAPKKMDRFASTWAFIVVINVGVF